MFSGREYSNQLIKHIKVMYVTDSAYTATEFNPVYSGMYLRSIKKTKQASS